MPLHSENWRRLFQYKETRCHQTPALSWPLDKTQRAMLPPWIHSLTEYLYLRDSSQLGEYLCGSKNFNGELFGSNSFRYFYTSLLTMCHVELYRVQSVTAAAHNGTNIKWNSLREGVEKVVGEWERREKKGKEGTLKRNICFGFGCLISRFRGKWRM